MITLGSLSVEEPLDRHPQSCREGKNFQVLHQSLMALNPGQGRSVQKDTVDSARDG